MTTPVDLDRLDALHEAARLQGTRAVGALKMSDGGTDWAVADAGNCVLAECFEVVGPHGYRQPAAARAQFIVEAAAIWPSLSAEIRALRAEVERLRAVRDAAVALLKFASRWEDGESHHYYCGIACAGGECDCGGNALRAALDAAAGGV